MAESNQENPQNIRRKPVIGITMGDPAGIGPEVIVKSLNDPELRRKARYVIFGMNEMLSYAADLCEIEPYWWRLQHDSGRADFDLTHDVVVLDYDEYSFLVDGMKRPTKLGGQASLKFLDDAIAAAMRKDKHPIWSDRQGHAAAANENRVKYQTDTSSTLGCGAIDAIVTAPVSKTSWHMAGCRFPGHTEFLQHRTKSKRVVMMFESPSFKVALATVHEPLMNLRNILSLGSIFDAIDLGHQACQRMGIPLPRIAVCGLNPHASEDGLFGDEEARVIQPAIEMAQNHNMNVKGPFPPDTVFIDARKGRYDLVVAMYHDQGLIPLKLLHFDEAVNTSLGLPLIRTSVDHGTAFDIVGKNKADPGSMSAAIELAIKLS